MLPLRRPEQTLQVDLTKLDIALLIAVWLTRKEKFIGLFGRGLLAYLDVVHMSLECSIRACIPFSYASLLNDGTSPVSTRFN